MALSMTTTVLSQGAERISRNLGIVIFKVVIASSTTSSGGDSISITTSAGPNTAGRKISDYFVTLMSCSSQWTNADDYSQTQGYYPQYNLDEDKLEFIKEVEASETAVSSGDTVVGTIYLTAFGTIRR
jgi:hypothetical protein